MILLINTNNPLRPVRNVKKSMYPYSLLYLANHILNNKINQKVKILDLTITKNPISELRFQLMKYIPYYVGFTGRTENRFYVKNLIEMTKKILPDSKIILGGNHFTHTDIQTLSKIKEADIIVRNEGEEALLDILKGKDLFKIKGITFRNGTEIIRNDDRPFKKDIDRFVLPIMKKKGKYVPYMEMRNLEDKEIKCIPIHIGRGCPKRCIYCPYNRIKYKIRTIKSIIEEIKKKKRFHKCKYFHFQDPFFTKRRDFVIKLCAELKKLKVKWYAETRADVDLPLLAVMQDSGCISLDFGLESASNKVLKAIKKDITIEQAQGLIDTCDMLGIRLMVFCMVSLPNETTKDAEKTYQFLKKNKDKIHNIVPTITRIYPNTELERLAKRRKIIPKNFNWYDRRYDNKMNYMGIPKDIPIYKEHLNREQIVYQNERLLHLNFDRLDIKKEVKKNLKIFLTKWNKEELSKKAFLIRCMLKAIKKG